MKTFVICASIISACYKDGNDTLSLLIEEHSWILNSVSWAFHTIQFYALFGLSLDKVHVISVRTWFMKRTSTPLGKWGYECNILLLCCSYLSVIALSSLLAITCPWNLVFLRLVFSPPLFSCCTPFHSHGSHNIYMLITFIFISSQALSPEPQTHMQLQTV